MAEALQEAQRAAEQGEVPIGAVLIHGDRILVRTHNLREARQDPTAHAELLAIREASLQLKTWRLLDTTLYVTLEPCAMCAGAIVLSRIPRLVFAIPDPKAGACGSLFNIIQDRRLNHQVEIVTGVLEEDSRTLIRDFFRGLRIDEDRDTDPATGL